MTDWIERVTITTSHVDLPADLEPWHPSRPHAALAADVRWWAGSPLSIGLFGRLALDQVAYRPVAAAVDSTGRFRENFADRGVRSLTYAMLLLFADEQDRRRDTDELKRLHRDVRGTGSGEFTDTRFSALDPQLWKWIAVSGLNIFYRSYTAIHPDLDPEQQEVVYQTLRRLHSGLELPSGQAKLPDTLADMFEYYEGVAAELLEDNVFLQYAGDSLAALPVPTRVLPRPVRSLVRPVWKLVIPIALRPTRVCGDALAHPKMQELLAVDRTWRDRLEYRIYLAGVQFAWRYLPRRLVLDPLVYNRYRYERLRDGYRSIQLESFAA